MGLFAEPGAHRVVPDVLDRVDQILVVTDHTGAEPTLEEVPDTVIPFVESLRVEAVQPMLTRRQARELGLDHQVVVISHQAIRVTFPPVSPHDLVKQSHESLSVLVVHVDRPLLHAARRDVEDTELRKQRPRPARHEFEPSQRDSRPHRRFWPSPRDSPPDSGRNEQSRDSPLDLAARDMTGDSPLDMARNGLPRKVVLACRRYSAAGNSPCQ